MKPKKNNVLIIAVVILALGLTYFLASYVVPKVMVSLTKAAPAYKVSLGDSKVLGQTILAKADGKDKCVVNVFIMDASGKGIPGRQVEMSGMETITPVTEMTDDSGKASFSMVSTTEAQYTLSATVDGVQMPETVKVTFRN